MTIVLSLFCMEIIDIYLPIMNHNDNKCFGSKSSTDGFAIDNIRLYITRMTSLQQKKRGCLSLNFISFKLVMSGRG